LVEHVAEIDTSGLFTLPNYSDAVYYRLLIPDLVDADRVIYLELRHDRAPILVGFVASRPAGSPDRATVDYLTLAFRDGDCESMFCRGKQVPVGAYCRDVVGIDLATTPCFNSGVMVMDLDAWRRSDLAARCRAECSQGRDFSLWVMIAGTPLFSRRPPVDAAGEPGFDGEFWEHAFRTPFGPKLRSEFAHSAAR
jgi:hypothetical protein